MKTDVYYGAPLIPQVNLQVSTDTYYSFLKAHGGFTWDFEIGIKEVSEIQKYLLNFLAENNSQLGTISMFIFCQRFGECKAREIRVSRINRTKVGWKFGDDY